MLINTSGVAIRINVSDISVTSRSTMGVTLMRTNEEEKVVAIAKISNIDNENREDQLELEGTMIVEDIRENDEVIIDVEVSDNEEYKDIV